MGKRILTGLLCALLTVALLPKTAHAAADYDLSAGDISISGSGPSSITIGYGSGQPETGLTLDQQFVIKTSSNTAFCITVSVAGSSENRPVKIKLKGVTINAIDENALHIAPGTHVALTLEDTNTLTSTSTFAVVHVPADAFLTIDGSGTLDATGYRPEANEVGGAGIGGDGSVDSAGEGCGSVTINGGVITANGGIYSAGIGGGGSKSKNGGSGGTVTINDGLVKKADGGSYNAVGGGTGIGGGGSESGNGGAGGVTIVNGGAVKAVGGSSGAGIGGGGSKSKNGGAGGTTTINGGTVVASAGSSGAGIGGGGTHDSNTTGNGGAGGTIVINGGAVYAWDGGSDGGVKRGAAIGGGGCFGNGSVGADATVTIGSFAYEWTHLNHVAVSPYSRDYTLGPLPNPPAAISNLPGFAGIRGPLTISPASGAYGGSVTVTITSPAANIIFIKYTLDGSDPKTSPSAQTYSGPFTVASGVQVKAYAEDHDPTPTGHQNNSAVVTAVYTPSDAPIPKTGDSAPILLLFALLMTSGAGLAVCAAVRRRAAKRA